MGVDWELVRFGRLLYLRSLSLMVHWYFVLPWGSVHLSQEHVFVLVVYNNDAGPSGGVVCKERNTSVMLVPIIASGSN